MNHLAGIIREPLGISIDTAGVYDIRHIPDRLHSDEIVGLTKLLPLLRSKVTGTGHAQSRIKNACRTSFFHVFTILCHGIGNVFQGFVNLCGVFEAKLDKIAFLTGRLTIPSNAAITAQVEQNADRGKCSCKYRNFSLDSLYDSASGFVLFLPDGLVPGHFRNLFQVFPIMDNIAGTGGHNIIVMVIIIGVAPCLVVVDSTRVHLYKIPVKLLLEIQHGVCHQLGPTMLKFGKVVIAGDGRPICKLTAQNCIYTVIFCPCHSFTSPRSC